MSKNRRVLNRIVSEPWAITRPALEEILAIAQRQNPSIEAVEAEMGRELDNTFAATIRDGVAILPIRGPLFRYASFFSRVSGATSYQELAIDLNTVLDDDAVQAILFDIDSPGGMVNGASELAEMIFAARGRKPMTAYVGGTGASAAYWLASAADEVVANDSAMLGSIGVIAAFVDTKEAERKAGLLTIEIVSSQSPKKNPDPAEEGGRAQIQRTIDDLGEVFVRAVARNRDVNRKTVLADFGGGDVMVGKTAVDAGLADRVGSFESVLAEVAERGSARAESSTGSITIAAITTTETTMPAAAETPNPTPSPTPTPSPAPAPQPEGAITLAMLEQRNPTLLAEIRTAAATAERERILGIMEIAPEGHDELVAELVRDPKVAKPDAALRILQAEREGERPAARRHLAAVQDDEEALEGGPKSAALRQPQGGGKPSDDVVAARLASTIGKVKQRA